MANDIVKVTIVADDRASGPMKNVNTGFATAAGTMTGMIAADLLGKLANGFAQLGEQISEVVSTGVESNAQFEQYEKQFEVLIGTVAGAEDRMRQLAEFGATTPFDLPGVVQADTIIQGFGLHSEAAAAKFGFSGEQIRTIAGDVASGTSASFTEMAGYIGKFSAGATGEAIARFQELGIVTREQLTNMGLEFAKSGELLSPLPEATEVLLTVMQDKYGGLMEAQSSTFEGMKSNLQDWMDNTTRVLTTPIFEAAKDALAGLMEILGSDGATSIINEFSNMLGIAIDTLGLFTGSLDTGGIEGWLSSLAEGMESATNWLQQFHDEIAGLSSEDIMQSMSIGVIQLQKALEESLNSLREKHADTIAGLQSQVANSTEAFLISMGDISLKYSEKESKIYERAAEVRERIESQISDKIISFQERVADHRQNTEEKLADMAEGFAKKRESIERSIQDKIFDFDQKMMSMKMALREKLSNLEDTHDKKRMASQRKLSEMLINFREQIADIEDKLAEDKLAVTKETEEERASLTQSLVLATTEAEKAAIQAEIDAIDAANQEKIEKLEATAKAEEDKLKEKKDRAVARVKEQIEREEAEYEKQVEKAKERAKQAEGLAEQKHNRAVAKLQERIQREEAEYNASVEKAKQRAAEDEARMAAKHNRAVAKLQERMAKEDEEAQKQIAKVLAQQAEEEASLKEKYDKQTALLQEQIAAEDAAYEEQRVAFKENSDAQIEQFKTDMTERAQAIGTGMLGEFASIWREDGLSAAFDALFEWIDGNESRVQSLGEKLGILLADGLMAALEGDFILDFTAFLIKLPLLMAKVLDEAAKSMAESMMESFFESMNIPTGQGIGAAAGSVLGFASGGTVPGPEGAPQLAVVHGGETITPPGEGNNFNITIYANSQAEGAEASRGFVNAMQAQGVSI